MPSPAPAPPRRALLLEAATDLFAARGYHAVGIDDIGAAAGITGPGVYRHFASKQALLESLCDRAMSRMLEGAQHIPTEHPEPQSALESLVDLHVDFSVGERALLSVWAREQRALGEEVRRSLRGRQRAYEQVWRAVLARLREDLDEAEVAVVVASTLALLNSTALVDTRVPDERLARLLRRMALSALLARRSPDWG
ncbi:MAG: putative transcriptional regulator, TetR family [Frankiales bacterium]|jgi:AcrR family transcriptional regulator|nr:putative transcriptional regulator, TetR family [Frankiales bacterium]